MHFSIGTYYSGHYRYYIDKDENEFQIDYVSHQYNAGTKTLLENTTAGIFLNVVSMWGSGRSDYRVDNSGGFVDKNGNEYPTSFYVSEHLDPVTNRCEVYYQ